MNCGERSAGADRGKGASAALLLRWGSGRGRRAGRTSSAAGSTRRSDDGDGQLRAAPVLVVRSQLANGDMVIAPHPRPLRRARPRGRAGGRTRRDVRHQRREEAARRDTDEHAVGELELEKARRAAREAKPQNGSTPPEKPRFEFQAGRSGHPRRIPQAPSPERQGSSPPRPRFGTIGRLRDRPRNTEARMRRPSRPGDESAARPHPAVVFIQSAGISAGYIFCGTMTIQPTPNLSVTMPKRGE